MKQPKQPDDREEYYTLSHRMRGEILDAAINLEIVIEEFIANYFCDTIPKMIEFKSYCCGIKKQILASAKKENYWNI
jgi:hypothetical protein